MKVGAIVLAAGGSARLGRPKQLLQFRGQTLVRRTVLAALGAGCRPVAVVVGAESARIECELVDLPVLIVPNNDWRRGIGSSIRRGVEAQNGCEALAILACDQPLLNAEVIKSLIHAQKETQKPIVACAYSGTLGIPALFARDFFEDLLALADEEGAKSIIATWPGDTVPVEFPGGALDIDTPEDSQQLSSLGTK